MAGKGHQTKDENSPFVLLVRFEVVERSAALTGQKDEMVTPSYL